jgi:hypothetical protein
MGCVATPFKPLSTGLRKPFTTYYSYFFMQLWGQLSVFEKIWCVCEEKPIVFKGETFLL